MADSQQMTSAPNKDGGRTVDGGGPPGAYPPPWAQALSAKVDRCERMLERIGKMTAEILERVGRDRGGDPPLAPSVAPDSDLDSERGNFAVKKDPKQWKGESCVGRTLSECPPEFLDLLAETKDFKAGKEDEDAAALAGAEQAQKKKYASYSRKDAARCRGWAARLRAGWKPAGQQQDGGDWD